MSRIKNMINYQQYINEVKKQLSETIESKSFILGPEVWKLEREISQYFGVKHTIGVNSGTDALTYSLKSLRIGAGDEVICPVFTFIATAEAIIWSGARPVFADIDSQTLNISPASIEKLVNPRTKAIIPVHLYGQPADMGEIVKIAQRRKLKIIEDVAQAFGAEYKGRKAGTIGKIGCLSFFPTKILGAFGDGGMILTNDPRLAKTVRMMRIHGAPDTKEIHYDHRLIGSSSRLDEIQAAILRVQFRYLNQNLRHRQKVARQYNQLLDGIGDLTLPIVYQGNYCVYNFYVIRTTFRNQLKEFLADRDIKTSILYPKPLHLFSAFKYFGYKNGDFPQAEKASREVLALPIDQFLSLRKVKEVADLIKEFFNNIQITNRGKS